ncbi:hypothetical protein NBRC110019_11240 [Neptunitalea chrysea]|uniref:DUF1573 domain-containing protein n=1 Tax=Neptunitalea chrysea TaxID=1647581 RepID=A0A9W6ETJ7_9FLAO|nr:DUF1573 domain-containing protein [Neptunitalea chrysea]GLB52085.1 hypothetical protein NBRC110019_11240 [Neptunitalea chrysea]
MKRFHILLLLCTLSAVTYAQKKLANIEFKTTEIDYGSIAKGSNGIRTFEFTNTGDAPLVITKVYSSCGCTIPKKPEKPIAPGKTGIIEVKYNTNRVGPIKKTITVYSNAHNKPTAALRISGTVENHEEQSVLMKKTSVMDRKN